MSAGSLGAARALDVVTGAFSYTGRAIAAELLARGSRVRSLSRSPAPPGSPIEFAPLRFDGSLRESLRGAATLFNTYWIRFERGGSTFERAIENSRVLFGAAREAGVERIVHVSVANASEESGLPYFRGKGLVEHALRECGVPYAIVRPTLVFGPDDILLNNISWILRRLPVFLVPGDGRYELQPVSVGDVARICADAADRRDRPTIDAAGPDRFSFEGLVRLVREAVRSRAWVLHAAPTAALALVRAANVVLRDVVLTKTELAALQANLLVSAQTPLGSERFGDWVTENGDVLGRRYTSELARNFRPHAAL